MRGKVTDELMEMLEQFTGLEENEDGKVEIDLTALLEWYAADEMNQASMVLDMILDFQFDQINVGPDINLAQFLLDNDKTKLTVDVRKLID